MIAMIATKIVKFVTCAPVDHETALTEEQVHAIVSSYEQSEVTARLEDFGRFLISANRERTKAIEGKATLIVGYSVAVLAFLVSKEPTQSVMGAMWPPLGVRVASICAAISLMFAFIALWVKSSRWLSDRQWFENENDVMEDDDRLRRCHVLAMHAANAKLRVSNDEKADNVRVAQASMIIAGLCLAGWLAIR
jgi:hypothetical protein